MYRVDQLDWQIWLNYNNLVSLNVKSEKEVVSTIGITC